MLFQRRWIQLRNWCNGLPLWANAVILPVFPIVALVCAVCFCPRTSLACAAILAGAYSWVTITHGFPHEAFQHGLVQLGVIYALGVASGYVSIAGELLKSRLGLVSNNGHGQ